ncbi:hypothetical protein [Agromyces bauzanensis]
MTARPHHPRASVLSVRAAQMLRLIALFITALAVVILGIAIARAAAGEPDAGLLIIGGGFAATALLLEASRRGIPR